MIFNLQNNFYYYFIFRIIFNNKMPPKSRRCIYCYESLNSNNYARHIKSQHNDKAISHSCRACKGFFSDHNALTRHHKNCKNYKEYAINQNKNADERRDFYHQIAMNSNDLKEQGWKLNTFKQIKITNLDLSDNDNIINFSQANLNKIHDQTASDLFDVNI